MSQPSTTRAYIYLHISVLLYGFTAILGKLISLPGAGIVWYRMVLTAISLLLFPGIIRRARLIPPGDRWRILGIGLLVALHWVAFYEAIKYSNASITLSCLASTTLFTSILEPILFKRSLRTGELVLGLFVILGFVFIFGFTGDNYLLGMVIAIISAILAALFSVLNKMYVSRYDVPSVILLEFVAGVVLMTFLMPVYQNIFPQYSWIPSAQDWIYLLVLSLLCTTLAYNLTMRALQVLSAFTTSLAINLEPVYGIIMAYFILREGEELHPGFYLGAGIILLAVCLQPLFVRK